MSADWRTNITLALLLLSVASCGWFRKAHKYEPQSLLSEYEKHRADSIIQVHQFDYEWLSAKCKIKLINKEGTSSFTATIRSRKDSIIWISISPLLGIEVGRLLLTTDSVYVLDRINNQRNVYGYSYLRRYTSIPVNFYTMQQVLCGTPLYYDSSISKAIRQDTTLMLTSDDGRVRSSLYLNRGYSINRMIIESIKEQAVMDMMLQSYQPVADRSFAHSRYISINDEMQTQLEMEFSKIIVNEAQKFPFPGK